MAVNYTSLLGLAKPVTGTEAGLWGDVVNDYLTNYLEAAVAGAQTISGNQTAVTLTVTTATALVQAAATSAGSSQYQIINCTGNPASTLVITAPASSKVYLVINATSTNQSVTVRGAGSPPTTGITIPALTRSLVAWNGSDYILIASNRITDLTGTLATTNGGTGLTAFTSGGAVYATSTSALTTGTLPTASGGTGLGGATPFTANKAVYASSTSALTTGTLPVEGGGTGAATLTANNVLLGNGTSAPLTVAPGTTGNVLTSNGTTWTSAALSLPAPATGIRASVYTSGSGNFTIPTGVTAVKVTLVGGGGGAGGGFSGACGPSIGGSGGGAASAIKYFSGLTPGGTIAYVVGAGGAGASGASNGSTGGSSSVTSGITVTCTGGPGGNSYQNSSTPGGGGSATNGDISMTGTAGFITGAGARGGASFFLRSYGGGGTGTDAAGEAGTSGIVVFEY